MNARHGFDSQMSFFKDKPTSGCHLDITLMPNMKTTSLLKEQSYRYICANCVYQASPRGKGPGDEANDTCCTYIILSRCVPYLHNTVKMCHTYIVL